MPKSVDIEARRQEILDACLLRFAERGYASISMRQIAASLGVTTGSLYHYFPSKRHILNGILIQRREQHSLDAQKALSHYSEPRQRLIALCDFIDERADSMSALLLVAIDAARVDDTRAQSVIKDVLASYVQVVSALLQVSNSVASLIMDITFGRLFRHAVGATSITLRQMVEPLAVV